MFISNVVKCRPPNNREPLKDEVDACLPFLLRQIAVLQPRVIVCLGKVALNNLLGTSHSMGRIRGQLLSFNDIPLVPTYHPSYHPAQERQGGDLPGQVGSVGRHAESAGHHRGRNRP